MKHPRFAPAIPLTTLTSQAHAEPIMLLGSHSFEWQTTPEAVAFAAPDSEMVHHASDENPEAARSIGPGWFHSIAAGPAHISACVSNTPCIASLYQDGAFEFLPVTK
ncbi:MAG: hypothetical protein AAFP85_02885 [Pseudomonadota bacterium]